MRRDGRPVGAGRGGRGSALAAAALAFFLPFDLAAQDAPEPPPPPPPASPATGEPSAPRTPTEETVEKVADVLSTVVFRSVAWFDRLFGNERYVPQLEEKGVGLLALGAAWSRVDGLEVPVRIRLDYPFPILRQRVSAILSSGDEDEVATDRDSWIRGASRPRSGIQDTSFLAGLGFVPHEGKKTRVQFRAGTRLGSTPEAIFQGRFRYRTLIGQSWGLRVAETVFYRTARGPGATTLVDLDRAVGSRTLVRLTLEGTAYTRERGLDWGTGVTAYRRVGADAAASLTVATEGARGGAVTPRYVGVRGSYRWPLVRNRLMIDVSGGLARARRDTAEPWLFSPSAGVLLELTFVERPKARNSGER